MPRYNVEYNGKWACFSGISDGFITHFMDKSDYEDWRKREYKDKYAPLEKCNIETMKGALLSIRINRSFDESLCELTDIGFEKDEAEMLFNALDNEYCRPKLNDNGQIICPNCKNPVAKGQNCAAEYCEKKLIW